jgi:hypothetical protein
MFQVLAVWWWLHPDYMAVAAVCLGLVTLGVAAWVARRQIELMREQVKLMQIQDAIVREQLLRKSDVRVRMKGQSAEGVVTDGPGGAYPVTKVRLWAKNTGKRGAEGFHWEIFIPQHLQGGVQFVDDNGEVVDGQFAPMSESELYDKLEGHYTHKLFPWSDVPIATIAIRNGQARTERFTVKWRVRTEDGFNPAQKLGEINFTRFQEWDYEAYHVPPGTEAETIQKHPDSDPPAQA